MIYLMTSLQNTLINTNEISPLKEFQQISKHKMQKCHVPWKCYLYWKKLSRGTRDQIKSMLRLDLISWATFSWSNFKPFWCKLFPLDIMVKRSSSYHKKDDSEDKSKPVSSVMTNLTFSADIITWYQISLIESYRQLFGLKSDTLKHSHGNDLSEFAWGYKRERNNETPVLENEFGNNHLNKIRTFESLRLID